MGIVHNKLAFQEEGHPWCMSSYRTTEKGTFYYLQSYQTSQFLTGDGVSNIANILRIDFIEPDLMILKDDFNQRLNSDLLFTLDPKNPILFKVPQQPSS